MKLLLARFFGTFLLTLLPATLAVGHEACFSADGNSVYLLGYHSIGEVRRLEINSGESTLLQFEGLKSDDPINAIARGDDNTLLLANSTGIWESGPDGGATRLLVKLTNIAVRDLVMAPAQAKAQTGMILVSGMPTGDDAGPGSLTLYAALSGKSTLQEVFCRRVTWVEAPIFATDGRLFYAGDHDLWEGSIYTEEGEDFRAGTLNGCRIAPLGIFNTDMANSGSMGVKQIAPAGEFLYVRLSGRHMGGLLRLPLPPSPYGNDDEGHPELPRSLSLMMNNLASTEIVIEGEISALAASPDGSRVFYRINASGEEVGQDWMLITDGGAPRRIGLEKWSEQ
ncbi:MAG: hypothetical protein KA250_02070 [Verrucomicrobiales bacterium]|nr:hypothetical protein [Verrucomicrobiales bacterium]